MQQKTQTFFKQNEPIQHKCLQGPIHIIPSWDPVDRNEKPPYSYATIIAHAILSSKERRLTLNEIYNWIMENYPFYCTTSLGWQVIKKKKNHFYSFSYLYVIELGQT